MTEEARAKKRAVQLAHYYRHRETRQAKAREWKKRNATRVQAYRQRYWQENKDEELGARRRWASEHPDEIKQLRRRDRERNGKARAARRKPRRNDAERARYARDPNYAIAKRLRASLNQSLRRYSAQKFSSVLALVGCSITELAGHLERQFLPGMSWENRAAWHIDHVRAVATFDLRQPAQQQACFHWTNLQPLWRADNLRKGAR